MLPVKREKYNVNGKVLNVLLCKCENDILMKVLTKRKVSVMCFDGQRACVRACICVRTASKWYSAGVDAALTALMDPRSAAFFVAGAT